MAQFDLRVYYEDTDAGGIVYHANYLKFMERARTEWLRELGYEQDALALNHGIYFVVKKIHIDYKVPARFNDELTVDSAVTRCGRASIEFSQSIRRRTTLLCEALVKVGCIDVIANKPAVMPEELFTEISHAAG